MATGAGSRGAQFGRAALCALATGALFTNPVLTAVGGIGVGVLASTIDANWSSFCSRVLGHQGNAADPLDMAWQGAIASALDSLEGEYRGPRSARDRLADLASKPDAAHTRFDILRAALLTKLDSDDVGQDTPVAKLITGSRQGAVEVFDGAVEAALGPVPESEEAWTDRNELAHFVKKRLPERVSEAFRAELNRNETVAHAFHTLALDEVRDHLQAIAESFNAAQLGKARIVPVADVQWGQSGPHVDILVPEWNPDAEQHLPLETEARARFSQHRALVITGKPSAGKSHLAGKLLKELPEEAMVVIPRGFESPPSFEALRGVPTVLLLDDFHERAEVFDPTPWWDALANWCPQTYLLVISRSGRDWDMVREKRRTFVERIPRGAFLMIERMDEAEAYAIGRNLGLTEDEVRQRSEGTIGSLRIDFSKMGDEYRKLAREERAGVFASRLIDAAKALHRLWQPVLHESLLRAVCEQVLGNGPLTSDQWRWLKTRTQDQGFGQFDENSALRTYAPYLEGTKIVGYDPLDDVPDVASCVLQRDDPIALFYLGVAARLDLGDSFLAEAAWRTGMELGQGRAAHNLGLLLKEAGRLGEAEAAWRTGMELGQGTAAFNLGLLLKQAGRLGEAEAAYRTGMELGDGEAASNLGLLLKEAGRLGEAEAAYRTGMELGADVAAFNLGLLLGEAGRLGEAEAAYRTGIELGNGGVASNLGLLLEKAGRLEEAEAVYRTGMELEDGTATFNLGALLRAVGRREEAEAAWRMGMELGEGVAAFNLGALLHEEGKLEEAEAAWRMGMELGEGVAARNLGVLLEEGGRPEEAEVAYRTGMELGEGVAASNLGLLLRAVGRPEEAEVAYRTGMELGNGGAASNLGLLLWASGRPEEAEAAYRTGMELEEGAAAFNLGALLHEEGKPEEAETAFRRAQELGVEFPH